VLVIPNSVDVTSYDLVARRDARVELGLPDAARIIGVVGRLHPKKRPDLALRGFAAAARDLPEGTTLVFAGDGPLAAELAADVAAAGPPGRRVRLLGHVANVARLMPAFDLLLVPSGEREAFGMTLIEAMMAGLPVLCLETRHAKAALQAQTVKTDRNDAKGLAHILRTGWFRAVHIKSEANQKLRVLLNSRTCLVDKRVDISNQIRGTLKVFGLKVGPVSKAAYETRIRALIAEDAELAAFILPLLTARRVLVEQERHLDKTIRARVKADTGCGRLMSIPGVGPLTALAFKSAIDQPQRFRKSRDVGPHVGLTPRK